MAGHGAQRGTAEAGERARASARLAGGPADDDIIAGTMANAARGQGAIFMMGAAILLLPPALLPRLPGILGMALTILAVTAVTGVASRAMTAWLHRPAYLIITRDELICYRVPKTSRPPAPAEVLFRAPPSSLRVTGRTDSKGQHWTVSLASRSPGAKDRLPTLTIDQPWHRELAEVMTTLHASGAEVQQALLAPAALTAAEPPGTADPPSQQPGIPYAPGGKASPRWRAHRRRTPRQTQKPADGNPRTRHTR